MAETCAHPACRCEDDAENMIEKGGKYYCSEGCDQEKGKIELRCGCGHPRCQESTPDYQI